MNEKHMSFIHHSAFIVHHLSSLCLCVSMVKLRYANLMSCDLVACYNTRSSSPEDKVIEADRRRESGGRRSVCEGEQSC